MRNIIVLIGSLLILCSSCKNELEPTIQLEYLKSDWVIKDSIVFYIEDSLIFFKNYDSDLFHAVNKYSISHDTMIMQPVVAPFQDANYKATFKILELTKNKLELKHISKWMYRNGLKYNRKLSLIRDTLTMNRKSIKCMEFSSTNGWGRTPNLDMRIDDDSMIYVMSYEGYSKYRGLYQHKLTNTEFERINRKINKIKLDSLESNNVIPDASYFTFLLETRDNTTHKFSGCLGYENMQNELYTIFEYLYSLEWILQLEKSMRDTLLIHSDMNRILEISNKNYAP